MNRKSVDSTLMRSVGYDAATNSLEIEMDDRDVYAYVDVPEWIYDGLMKADSKGRYFNSQIKGRYRVKKILEGA